VQPMQQAIFLNSGRNSRTFFEEYCIAPFENSAD
jgi:hypothetical protein